jgi:hypothetical protein
LVGVTKFKDMTDYYEKCLVQGEKYQEFVSKICLEVQELRIDVYKKKQEQYNIGESRQGYEIKNDDRYKETKNIYIEIAEKTNENNSEYINSGIYRGDNSHTLIIGNYDVFYFFSIKQLRKIHKMKKKYFREITTKTSKGFLLSQEQVDAYCLYRIEKKDNKYKVNYI